MERVLCYHGVPCNLMTKYDSNTGSVGDSFYVCRKLRRKDRCAFRRKSTVEPSYIEGYCPVHTDTPITLRTFCLDDGAEKIEFTCPKANLTWCGHYYLSAEDKAQDDSVNASDGLKSQPEVDKQEGSSQDNSTPGVVGSSSQSTSVGNKISWRLTKDEEVEDSNGENEEEGVSDDNDEEEEEEQDEDNEEEQDEVVDGSSRFTSEGNKTSWRSTKEVDVEDSDRENEEEEESASDDNDEEVEEEQDEDNNGEGEQRDSVADYSVGDENVIQDSMLLLNTEFASTNSDYSDQEKENKEPVDEKPLSLPQSSVPCKPKVQSVGGLTDQFGDMGLLSDSSKRGAAAVEETDSAVSVKEDKDEDDDEEEEDDDKGSTVFKPGRTYRKLCRQLLNTRQLFAQLSGKLHDGGAKLIEREQMISLRMKKLRGRVPSTTELVAILQSYAKEEDEGKHKVPVKKQLLDTQLTKMLTSGVVKHLHTSLASCPTDTDLADTPTALTVSLLEHQRRALKWMWWREEQVPSGGILADDMGLGKTLSTISLLVVKKQEDRQTIRKVQDLISINATLIVVPASLMHMWEAEIKSKVKPGVLRVKIYHGSSRPKDPSDLQLYNVVITTYNIVGIEGGTVLENADPRKKKRVSSSTALFQLHWKRVVLDEGHTIRNPKSNLSQGCSGLSADHRWVLTGTPVQNKLEDFYSLIRFLRLAPFDNIAVWKQMIGSGSRQGMQRLKAMVATLVLRRTKEEQGRVGIPHLKLPDKVVVTHYIELTPKEKAIYDVLFSQGRAVFTKYLENKGELSTQKEPSQSLAQQLENVPSNVASALQKLLDPASKGYSGILVLLLRLRQCCSHLCLLRAGLARVDETGLEAAMKSLTLDAAPCVDLPMEFSNDYPSAKVTLMLTKLREIISCDNEDEPPYKCIVVSQWTSMLRVVAGHLDANRISHITIDGTIPPMMRQSLVERFNSSKSDPRVMLLSLQAGGVGLNLIGANHVLMLDLHWNPQLEVQASDRCHRVGQTRDVTVHRFVTKDTIESAILLLQESKLKLADDVLSGARAQKGSRFQLTLQDLKELFEM